MIVISFTPSYSLLAYLFQILGTVLSFIHYMGGGVDSSVQIPLVQFCPLPHIRMKGY